MEKIEQILPEKIEERSFEIITKELEEQAKNVETFNPRWHDGAFLGPNTLRQKADSDVYGKMEGEP